MPSCGYIQLLYFIWNILFWLTSLESFNSSTFSHAPFIPDGKLKSTWSWSKVTGNNNLYLFQGSYRGSFVSVQINFRSVLLKSWISECLDPENFFSPNHALSLAWLHLQKLYKSPSWLISWKVSSEEVIPAVHQLIFRKVCSLRSPCLFQHSHNYIVNLLTLFRFFFLDIIGQY